MSKQLKEIQQILSAKADKKDTGFFEKMVPGKQKIYGVKTPQLNLLAQQYKSFSFDLTKELWESGALEETNISLSAFVFLLGGAPVVPDHPDDHRAP